MTGDRKRVDIGDGRTADLVTMAGDTDPTDLQAQEDAYWRSLGFCVHTHDEGGVCTQCGSVLIATLHIEPEQHRAFMEALRLVKP